MKFIIAIVLLIAVNAGYEVECPSPDHPGIAIITCPVPKECPHHNWPLTEAEKQKLTKDEQEQMSAPLATVYDYTNKPADGSKPVTKHILKSKSPCGCIVKGIVCKCIPSGEYKGTCTVTGSSSSFCTYEIKCDKKEEKK